MAIGFTPKHIAEYPLEGLSTEEFLILVLETAKEMNWEVSYQSHSGLIARTANGLFSWNGIVTIKIHDDVATIHSESLGGALADWGKNKRTVTRFHRRMEELKGTFSKEDLHEKYQEVQDQLVPPDQDVLMLPPATIAEKFDHFLSLFKPKESYYITPVLLNLNILVFLAMVASGVNFLMPGKESLVLWGANFRPVTLDGQWWRLVTSYFVHIGILHLLMNMYALFIIGVLLEPKLGKLRFSVVYLLSGVSASAASLWWNDLTISAGASGAIFGMYGAFLVMLTSNLIEPATRKALLPSILVFVGYNLISGLQGGIDNAAHLGGLVAGAGIGWAFLPSLKQPEDVSFNIGTISILCIFVLASTYAVYTRLPNDVGTYDRQIKKFVSMEAMALEAYHMPPYTPKDVRLTEIKDRGIYYWKENIALLDGFEELDLPLQIRTRNQQLKEYCEIRIKSYELQYKAIEEETDRYQPQILEYDKQINAKIEELRANHTP
ncbi:rhomboid protease GluP [Dyadobacter jejuensis]|uniref:Rhomboid protease GluP n=1 Tax=Dyadobacter jejuensis TaxID=1082580 RepID=A0A316AGS5_9BACT|nr:rhomboid family intramembrane serine protease [Dyadobacter jejuensis]PWJ56832.1 rhomboid protease GluP [Dyadobacter jejuensis]